MIQSTIKIIGRIFFKSSVLNFLKYLTKKIKINKEEIQNNNCGLYELTKNKVIGHINMNIKKICFFLFLIKKGIRANNEKIELN